MPARVHPKVKDGELTKKECEECCTYDGKVTQRKMKVRGWTQAIEGHARVMHVFMRCAYKFSRREGENA